MTYGLWNSPLRGIEVNQATLISAFRFFWKEIENADTDTEYYDVEGLKKYSALVLRKNIRNIQIGLMLIVRGIIFLSGIMP